jgi:hypothetical protein
MHFVSRPLLIHISKLHSFRGCKICRTAFANLLNGLLDALHDIQINLYSYLPAFHEETKKRGTAEATKKIQRNDKRKRKKKLSMGTATTSKFW